LFYNIDNLDYR